MDLFKPDIFSQSTPNWIKATPYLENELAPIISQIVPSSSLNELVIEFSGSMEINSSNFKKMAIYASLRMSCQYSEDKFVFNRQ